MPVTAGRLGAQDLSASTNTLLYECPADTEAFVSVQLVARGGTPTVRIALADNGTPAAEDWIEYDVQLAQGGPPLLREGIYLKATDRIYVWASATGVSAVAYGKEAEAS
jgi:hypothetical protein